MGVLTANERVFRIRKDKVNIAIPPPEIFNLEAAFLEDQENRFASPLKHRKPAEFAGLKHLELLEAIEKKNALFQYHYSIGGRFFYQIPVTSSRRADLSGLATRIARDKYEQATTVIDNASRLGRILRAIRYHDITVKMRRFIVKELIIEEENRLERLPKKQREEVLKAPKEPFYDKTTVIGLDRGNRLPATILSHLLNPAGTPLFVDTNGVLNEKSLEVMAKKQLLRGQHILLVDAEFIDQRKIENLREYFGPNNDPNWRRTLGHSSWSITGPSRTGHTVCSNHLNIDWGIDPECAFGTSLSLPVSSLAKARANKKDCGSAIIKTLQEILSGHIFDEAAVQQN